MTCKNATLPEILELSPRLEDADPEYAAWR